MSSLKANITIAIVGGGLGGLCAAIALGRAGYAVRIFEQASEFSEIGAGVIISPNSFRALVGIHPSLREAYEKVADLQEEGSVYFRMHSWKDGEAKFEVCSKGGPNSTVHRRRVLEVLLPLVPANVTTEFSAHVADVENVEATAERPAFVRLTIEPSQKRRDPNWPGETRTFEADAVIGCDGVKSIVRKCIGATGPNGLVTRYTGTYVYRALIDSEKVRAVTGESVMTPLMYCGPDAHIVAYPIERGKVFNFGAMVSDRSEDPSDRVWNGPWVKPVSSQEMYDDFAGWNEHVRDFIKLVEKPERWALHETLPLEYWTRGRITLLGDSAHASLPFNGAGAGQAIEDAYVLGELLQLPECTREALPHFLLAYEGVRRPRATRQQISSRETGEIYQFASPMGDDWEQLAKHVPLRHEWLWLHNLSEDVVKAKEQLKAEGLL